MLRRSAPPPLVAAMQPQPNCRIISHQLPSGPSIAHKQSQPFLEPTTSRKVPFFRCQGLSAVSAAASQCRALPSLIWVFVVVTIQGCARISSGL